MTNTTDNTEVRLPGFGLRQYGNGEMKMFPHVLEYGGVGRGVTLRERRMLAFIGAITDKPDWHRKVFDDAIVEKWKEESLAMPPLESGDVYMSPDMFTYCITELREKAVRFEKVGFVDVLDTEVTVVKSDSAVPADLQADLKRCAAVLEDVPAHQQDWHPGSNNQVLDLVHPSLFPIVFGKTRALRTGTVPLDRCMEFAGKGELTDKNQEDPRTGMDAYQWLPSDVTLTDAGASITSYINNLHPLHHKELYGVLERFVAAAVPLWNECLSPWPDRRRIIITSTDDENDYYIPEGVKYQVPREDDNGFHGDGEGDADSTGEPESEDYKYEDDYQEWWRDNRVLSYPEPDEFQPFEDKIADKQPVDLKSQFPNGLQVIFKLANIHLTPDKPKYAGGSWHIEGTLTEFISATALYYYDEDNITASQLSFRQALDEEEMVMMPAQSAYDSLLAYFGVEFEGLPIQDLGGVQTSQGRLLVFPNVLQHRVGSFRLKDPTRPGHRKILAMFLIDPHRRILSTANVPPQQKDWWAGVAIRVPPLANLPPELASTIVNSVDSDMEWDEALKIREKLMRSRSDIREEYNDSFDAQRLNFCEH